MSKNPFIRDGFTWPQLTNTDEALKLFSNIEEVTIDYGLGIEVEIFCVPKIGRYEERIYRGKGNTVAEAICDAWRKGADGERSSIES